MKKSLAISFLILIAKVAFSQGTVQSTLNTSSSNGDAVRGAWAMEDGGALFLLDGEDYLQLWRGDAQGAPMWAISLPGEHYHWNANPMPDGGLILLCAGPNSIDDTPFGFDTLHYATYVTRLDEMGMPLWARKVEWTAVDYDAFSSADRFESVATLGGDVYLKLKGWDSFGYAIVNVVKLNSAGELQWSRFVGIESVTPQPVMHIDDEYLYMSASATDGSLWMTRPFATSPQDGMVLHISAEGNGFWRKNYHYAVSGADQRMPHIIPLSGGDMLLHGHLYLGSGQYAAASRITANGDLLRTDIYGPLVGASYDHRGVHLEDDRVLLHTGQNLFLIDSGASVLGGIRLLSAHNDALTYDFAPLANGRAGSSIMTIGQLVSVHDVFGVQINYPGIWKVDPLAAEGCMMEPLNPDHLLVPDSLMSIDVDTIYGVVPSITIVTDTTFSPVFITPYGTHITCEDVVSIAEPTGWPTLSVIPSVLHVGQEVLVRCNSAVTLSLVGSDGRICGHSVFAQADRSVTLPTMGLSAGSYAVRAISEEGIWHSTARLVLLR